MPTDSTGIIIAHRNPPRGYHLHIAGDGDSRLAYAERLADESKDFAAAFGGGANAWFTK